MNNILDYTHMIKTYVMTTDFDLYNNISTFECKCNKTIECFQINQLNKCLYHNLIMEKLPLFENVVP